jgi:hypothetical protein
MLKSNSVVFADGNAIPWSAVKVTTASSKIPASSSASDRLHRVVDSVDIFVFFAELFAKRLVLRE